MLGGRDAVEKLDDFCRAEHHGQGLRRLRRRDHALHRPRLLERDGVEEAECGHGDHDGRRRQLFVVGQIDLVRTNLFGAQQHGRPAEVPGEAGDVLHVRTLGERGQIAHLHVLEHALPKGVIDGSSVNAPGPFQVVDGSVCEDRRSNRASNRWENPEARAADQKVDLPPTAKRFSRVLGMFSSLEVQVLSQPDGGEG